MYKFIIISIILLSFLFGQTVLDKENEYLELQSGKQIAEQQLDSLNNSLDAILKKIDEEKSGSKDENKTANLMSSALSITKKIERKEEQIKKLNGSIVKLERALNTIYSKQMAGLEKKLRGKITESDEIRIEQELIVLAGKRIGILPLFQSFKFNPAKINAIDMANITDELEKAMSMDYLKSALAQVDSNIHLITERTQDLEDNKRLEDKAALFMDDVAESRVLGFYESSVLSDASSETDGVYGRKDPPIDKSTEWAYVQDNAIANTIDFLSQLEYLGMPPDDQISRYKISANSPVNAEEYLEILKSSGDFLKLYKNMLLKKMTGK